METKFSKYSVKIPKAITCHYDEDRNFLFIRGKLGSCLIKLKVKICFVSDRIILVTRRPVLEINPVKLLREIKGIQANTKTLIEKKILDVSRTFYKKLKLVGVGFKVSLIDYKSVNLLKFELGYSHSFYLRIPVNLEVTVNSATRLVVSGTSSHVSDFCSLIRKLRPVDSYKGKGVLYESENVQLKVVKKS